MLKILGLLTVLIYDIARGGEFDKAVPKPFIVGGSDITIEEAPYSLIFEYNSNALCAAAILSETYAITSGNCVEGFTDDEYKNAIRVRSGSTSQGRDGDVHTVKNYTLHPLYNGLLHDYDVAIIEVNEPFRYGDNADAVPISVNPRPIPPSNITITGWGYTSPNGGGGDDLQRLDLPVIGIVACRTALMDYMSLTDRMFCAYADQAGPCYRDFGAPVTVNGTLIGVFSAIVGCAREFMPAVLTDVNHPEIRSWIRTLTGV